MNLEELQKRKHQIAQDELTLLCCISMPENESFNIHKTLKAISRLILNKSDLPNKAYALEQLMKIEGID